MTARIEIAPEMLAQARVLYEQTLTPVYDIHKLIGVSRTTFYDRVREGNWKLRTYSVSEAPDKAIVQPGKDAPHARSGAIVADEHAPITPERKAALRARLYGMLEEAMDATQQIMRTVQPGSQAQSERSARTTAHLVRTMRDVDAMLRPEPVATDDANEPDELPRTIDDLRAELASRLNAFIDSHAGSQDGGTQSSDR